MRPFALERGDPAGSITRLVSTAPGAVRVRFVGDVCDALEVARFGISTV
jgi:hypothetical protein